MVHVPQSRLSLEEQLMTIHSLRDRLKWNEHMIGRMGQLVVDFRKPALLGKTIDGKDIELLAAGYQFAGRKESAIEAFNFLCSKWPTPSHFHSRRLCFEHFGLTTDGDG